LPQLIITFVFFYWPPARRLAIVPARGCIRASSEFIGLENYQALFADPQYYKAMLTTVVFSTLSGVVAVDRAVVCHPGRQESEGGAGLQDLHDWPYAVAPAVAGVLWIFMFQPSLARSRGLCARWASTGIAFERQHGSSGGDGRVWKQISTISCSFSQGCSRSPKA